MTKQGEEDGKAAPSAGEVALRKARKPGGMVGESQQQFKLLVHTAVIKGNECDGGNRQQLCQQVDLPSVNVVGEKHVVVFLLIVVKQRKAILLLRCHATAQSSTRRLRIVKPVLNQDLRLVQKPSEGAVATNSLETRFGGILHHFPVEFLQFGVQMLVHANVLEETRKQGNCTSLVFA